MKKLLFSLLCVAGVCMTGCGGGGNIEPYKNTKLSFEERAKDLVSRMTLEEKISQLTHRAAAIDRLGVPEYNWWNECLHGVGRSGLATVFPQAIGMAAMWDDQEMFDIANVISDEARAKHHDYVRQGKRLQYQGLTYWTPNINIFRDPRWGRGMETYGEDPYLTGELAVDFIKGLQGDDPKYLKLVATSKHFVVHSGPESTRHSADVHPSNYDFYETYTPHFKKTIDEAGVYSVMCAYQRLNGDPCCGSEFLGNLLRNEWGFKGYIVSDCGAIADFWRPNNHHVVETRPEAAAMGIKAGTDLNCGDTYPALMEAVEQGLITEAEIDVAVERLMLARMKLGMFDPDEKVPYAQIPITVLDSKEHKAMALDAARKSMVLLKNDGILPLSKDVKKIAVIGPNANDKSVLLANYYGFPSEPKTMLTGIKEKMPDAEVVFAQGSRLATELPYLTPIPTDVLFTDQTLSTNGLKAEFFNNSNLEGTAVHERIDPQIDFEWWTTPPFEDLNPANYSIRWSGYFVPKITGEYALGANGMSGYKVFIDDKPLVRYQGIDSPMVEYEIMKLTAGKKYKIVVEYNQDKSEYTAMQLLWDYPKPNLKQEAVDLAKNSDVVIMCMGLSPQLEGEEMKVKVKGFSHGDREDIQLPESQTDLIRAIQATGKPIVLVLLNGSAVAFNWEAENIPAILEAWYPGQAGGEAVADVLWGDYNPAGRLPVTFYKSIDQISAFDNYDMKGKTYRYFTGEPLYEFGYGLSYTNFEYNFKSIPESVKAGKDIKVAVDVTNTGKMDGDEVVQLYVSLPESKHLVPVRSLQGFKRIHLKAGETQTVEFTLTPNQFAARDDNNAAVVEEGEVLISVGGKQPDSATLAKKGAVQKGVKITGKTYYAEN